ncbi:MAG: hypothetical protein NVV68_06890 [Dokdonella sp.]|nr:hypothetical protein [Dokdonella sp.]
MNVVQIRNRNLLLVLDRLRNRGISRRKDQEKVLGGIGQSFLSQLKGGKPMGDEVARKISLALGYDEGWMDRPQWDAPQAAPGPDIQLAGDGAEEVDIAGMVRRFEWDILSLRTVLSAVLASLARSTPGAAAEIHDALRQIPEHTHGYLADVLHTIREAQRATAEEQLDVLRREASSGGRKP